METVRDKTQEEGTFCGAGVLFKRVAFVVTVVLLALIVGGFLVSRFLFGGSGSPMEILAGAICIVGVIVARICWKLFQIFVGLLVQAVLGAFVIWMLFNL